MTQSHKSHSTFAEDWHRRQQENLARIDAAIKRLGELHERDRKLGQELVQAFTDLSQGTKKALEAL